MGEHENSNTLDYSTTHTEGTIGEIPAANTDNETGAAYHVVELCDSPGTQSKTLTWRCKRCGEFFTNPKSFEEKLCIPWSQRNVN